MFPINKARQNSDRVTRINNYKLIRKIDKEIRKNSLKGKRKFEYIGTIPEEIRNKYINEGYTLEIKEKTCYDYYIMMPFSRKYIVISW